MKRLLIDANPIVPYYVTGRVTGIGRTTLELIQALARIPNLPLEGYFVLSEHEGNRRT